MYRVHWQGVPDAFKFFDCIGHGPGTRPARQHAWSFRLRRGVDFESIPIVEAIEFDHDETCSRRIIELFEDGDLIYPTESLVEVTRKLVALPIVTMSGIRTAIARDVADPTRVEELAELTAIGLSEELGKDVVDGYDLALDQEDVEKGRAEAEQFAKDLLRNVGALLLRTPKHGVHAEAMEGRRDQDRT